MINELNFAICLTEMGQRTDMIYMSGIPSFYILCRSVCVVDSTFVCVVNSTFVCVVDSTFVCAVDSTFVCVVNNTFVCVVDSTFVCVVNSTFRRSVVYIFKLF